MKLLYVVVLALAMMAAAGCVTRTDVDPITGCSWTCAGVVTACAPVCISPSKWGALGPSLSLPEFTSMSFNEKMLPLSNNAFQRPPPALL
jgi:hypothetical protein